jgi:hypothetical protein
MSGGKGPGGAGIRPIEMLESAADLMNPLAAAKQMPWLAGELVKIPLGRSGIAFEEGDRRFADVTWQENVFFRLLGRRLPAVRGVDGPDGRRRRTGPGTRQARARYLANLVTAMTSPTNFF